MERLTIQNGYDALRCALVEDEDVYMIIQTFVIEARESDPTRSE